MAAERYSLPVGRLSSPTQYVGYSNTGSFVQSGGTNVVSGTLYIGFGLSGSYLLSGGLLFAPSTYPYEEVGNQVSASFTQSGGTNSTPEVYLGNNLTGSGTYNLNGGLLTLGTSGVTKGVGSAAFNFGGGTLGASSPWSSSVNMTLTGLGGLRHSSIRPRTATSVFSGHSQRQRRFDEGGAGHADP